jgi:hypothetical protein
LVTTIVDGVTAIRATLVAVNTPKGKQAARFKPSRRPLTAQQRWERRQDREMVAEIVAIAAPPGRVDTHPTP